jgi:Tfp pilus assembly protein PilF
MASLSLDRRMGLRQAHDPSRAIEVRPNPPSVCLHILTSHLRKHQRALEKTQRELDRERTKLENQEKKLVQDIKKNAKNGQMGAVKIQAKDLVRTRRYIQKFYQMRTQLQAISLRIQVRPTQLSYTALG